MRIRSIHQEEFLLQWTATRQQLLERKKEQLHQFDDRVNVRGVMIGFRYTSGIRKDGPQETMPF